MTVKEYRKLSKNMKKGLRREYKLRRTDEHKFGVTINLLFLASCFFFALAVMYALFFNMILGGIFASAFFIVLCMQISFVIKANDNFNHFLEKLDRKI